VPDTGTLALRATGVMSMISSLRARLQQHRDQGQVWAQLGYATIGSPGSCSCRPRLAEPPDRPGQPHPVVRANHHKYPSSLAASTAVMPRMCQRWMNRCDGSSLLTELQGSPVLVNFNVLPCKHESAVVDREPSERVLGRFCPGGRASDSEMCC
jgi:hypothetical protein